VCLVCVCVRVMLCVREIVQSNAGVRMCLEGLGRAMFQLDSKGRIEKYRWTHHTDTHIHTYIYKHTQMGSLNVTELGVTKWSLFAQIVVVQ
jgi:hypothetical protein